MLHILFILALLLPSSSHAADFCVAKLKGAGGVSGYACRPPANVTADDFVYTGLRVPGNMTNKVAASPAFVNQFPGLNGLGISIAKIHIAPGGVVPMHTHPAASELLFIIEGKITAGFISTANVVYVKTLSKSDIMVFPRGLLHFQVNAGDTPAVVTASFNSPEPGIQNLDAALFGSDLSSAFIEASTLLDLAQIKKLKGVLGGTN